MEDRRAGMGISGSVDKTPEANIALQLLMESFPEGILEASSLRGEDTALIAQEYLAKVMTFLKDDPRLAFNVLIDITAVDYPSRKPRFEIVYHLVSIPFNKRIRIKTRVSEDTPEVDSLAGLWNGANWLEREVWDMFGIRFKGHPNLKRILMYEEFQGHPLRKDYPIQKRQPLIGPKN
jgi:NADH-quinone oxidoreductase subunit C